MNTFVFQPNSTWRKLGYAFLSDSLSYREVLDSNPFWDITKSPAPGTVLYKPPVSGSTVASLSQAPTYTEVNISSGLPSGEYYPFTTQAEFDRALARYSSSSIYSRDRDNGWSATSYQVQTGVQ